MPRPRLLEPIHAALLAAALAGCGQEGGGDSGLPDAAGRIGQDTLETREETEGGVPAASDTARLVRREHHARLERAYAELEKRLDAIWADSLNVRTGMRDQYRRLLGDAVTVKDNTKVFLEELRVSSEGVTPAIWERLRARAELSLDSLRALLQAADTLSGSGGPSR